MTEPVEYGLQSPGHRRQWLQRVGLIAIALMTVAVAAALPLLNRTSGAANQDKCYRQLRAIGNVISLYADENGGQLPDTLSALSTTQLISPHLFRCPASGAAPATDAAALDADGGSSYVYLRPGSRLTTLPATAVLLYESEDHHGGAINLLRADGTVMALTRAEAKTLTDSLPTTRIATWPTTQPALR